MAPVLVTRERQHRYGGRCRQEWRGRLHRQAVPHPGDRRRVEAAIDEFARPARTKRHGMSLYARRRTADGAGTRSAGTRRRPDQQGDRPAIGPERAHGRGLSASIMRKVGVKNAAELLRRVFGQGRPLRESAGSAAVPPRISPTETPIEPVPSSRRLITRGGGIFASPSANGPRRETNAIDCQLSCHDQPGRGRGPCRRSRRGRPIWTPVRRSMP